MLWYAFSEYPPLISSVLPETVILFVSVVSGVSVLVPYVGSKASYKDGFLNPVELDKANLKKGLNK